MWPLRLEITAATTEGYASRPGGAQAELLAEVNQHESERNLALLWDEFRNYQNGIMPAGLGARELTDFFAHVDAKLDPAAAPAARVQRSDREIRSLLTKRASVLHLGTANYCWFTDPSRALCLRLADDQAGDKPLIGMCDSARCPPLIIPATGPSGPSTPRTYWTGWQFANRAHFPNERSSWSAATVILAADALSGTTEGSGLFRAAGTIAGAVEDGVQPLSGDAGPERSSTRSDPSTRTSANAPDSSARR